MLLMSDKNWIQKATKNMRKDKPCTGEKFGSETCPPGSKRYNLAKTFRKMAKEGHKLASLEKASVLSASDDPEDQDKAREIRVRHDYESLKKQISSKKKPDKPAVKEEVIDERLGGKGYKPYTSLTGKKVSGDWEDSDRGAGNKAKKRAGGKVKKKSPTYLAYVLNKEEVECDCDCGQDPCIKCGESHHNIKETVAGGVPLTPQELEIQKKMSKLNVRLARKRNQQMSKAKVDDTESSPEQVKEGKGYQPEIEHSKLGDAKKKKDKERESKLPPHLQGDAIGKMKKAFASEAEDRAFNLVRDKLKAKYGSGVLTTGEKPKDTRSEKSKVKAQRKRAASDEKERRFKKRNPAVTSGRYPRDDEKAWAAAREREKREGIS